MTNFGEVVSSASPLSGLVADLSVPFEGLDISEDGRGRFVKCRQKIFELAERNKQ